MNPLITTPDAVALLVKDEHTIGTAFAKTTTWGEFRRDNASDPDTIKAVYRVVIGEVASITIGGGAQPLVTITRLQ